MDEKLTIITWALEMSKYGRKPHRLRPEHTTLACDLVSILALSAQRKAIAERYCNGLEYAADEAKEAGVISELQTIGKRYGWCYGSKDDGLSSFYRVVWDDVKIDISIPMWSE